MVKDIIEEDGEVALSAFIATQDATNLDQNHMHFLQCCFFQAGIKPPRETLENIITNVNQTDHYKVYLCNDGDVFFQWEDVQKDHKTQTIIKNLISEQFGDQVKSIMPLDTFFIDYNIQNNINAIRAECFKKQGRITKSAQELSEYMQNPQLIATFKNTIQLISTQRMMRVNPQILIVEDQAFSQKILLSALKDYTCHVADTTGDAMVKYMEKCPDIVLLDIDLPDVSGHDFARFLKDIDPQAYVIMVTANQYESDVKKSKENNAMGFIPKPYKKEIILDAIEKFKINRKKKAS